VRIVGHPGIAIVAALLLACRESAPPVVATEPAVERADAAGPVAPAAPAKEPIASACLMVNVCDCNLGCAAIRLPRAQLVEGTHTRVLRGPLEGQEVKIVEVTDGSGARVLALTDLAHDQACSLPSTRALVGYGCAASDFGPVPAKACARGCD
jgi:hypothetical protein